MNPVLASFTAGGIGLAVFVLTNLLVLRIPGRLAPVPRQALLGILIHALTTLLAAELVPRVTYWHGAALYWLGFNSYVFVFSAVYKSVSLRILSELARSPNQTLGLDAIAESHVLPCFTQRTGLLVQSGLAHEQEGTFTITARGQQLSARFARLQRFFGVKRSGLYTS